MPNEIILFIEIFVIFSMVVLADRFFGEKGLVAWMAVASCVAQIGAAKTVDVFGMGTSAGSVLFASTFLVTDILTERYSQESAKKAVYIGFLSVAAFVTATTFINVMSPSPTDFAGEAIATLFGIVPRISAASISMYFVANIADVFIYEKLREKTGGRFMWFRNNFSTILTNGAENFLFFFLAFGGVKPAAVILELAFSTTIVETIIALCDTPFLYLAKTWGSRRKVAAEEA